MFMNMTTTSAPEPWDDPSLTTGIADYAERIGYPAWCVQAALCLACREKCRAVLCDRSEMLELQARPLAKMFFRDVQGWAKDERIRRLRAQRAAQQQAG
jgi:hypothetical protein